MDDAADIGDGEAGLHALAEALPHRRRQPRPGGRAEQCAEAQVANGGATGVGLGRDDDLALPDHVVSPLRIFPLFLSSEK
jgi:hypothetical protein